MLNNFYFKIWKNWALRVILCSVTLATIISFFITTYIYFKSSATSLNSEIQLAIVDITIFWFPIVFSATLLIALIRSIKYIFEKCHYGYAFRLYTCSGEEIEGVGYGDLTKVWRKWLIMLIWFSSAFVIISAIFVKLFGSSSDIFGWFNIYYLLLFILISGYGATILLPSRLKNVKVKKC